MDVLLCTASIWHMCTMSLDRYCTLRYPISYGRSRTRTSVRLKIAFVWVVSTAVCGALGVAGFADYSNVYVDRQCVPAVKHFVLYGSILAFYVPLVIMVVTYVLTVRILAENRRTMASLGLQKAAGKGDWSAAARLDGPVAAKLGGGGGVRQGDGGPPPPSGRYRRKSVAGGGAAALTQRSNAGSDAARTDEPSRVSALRQSDRHLTEPDLTSADAGGGTGDLSRDSRSCPLGINWYRSNQSSANLSSRRSTTSIPPAAELDRHHHHDEVDDVGGLCLVTLFSLEGRSGDSPERARRMLVCRRCFESLLKSAAATSTGEAPSTNTRSLRAADNDRHQRRRSEEAQLDYGRRSSAVGGGKRNSEMDLGSSVRSLVVRGAAQRRPSCVELRDATAEDLDRVPSSSSKNRRRRVGNWARSSDAAICRVDPPRNWPAVYIK